MALLLDREWAKAAEMLERLVSEMRTRRVTLWIEALVVDRLAELERACGDAAAAERELREAQRLHAEMGATGHAKRLARELRG